MDMEVTIYTESTFEHKAKNVRHATFTEADLLEWAKDHIGEYEKAIDVSSIIEFPIRVKLIRLYCKC